MNAISRDGAWTSQCSREVSPPAAEDASAVKSTKPRKPRRRPANAVTAGDDSRDFIGRGAYKIVLTLVGRSIDEVSYKTHRLSEHLNNPIRGDFAR